MLDRESIDTLIAAIMETEPMQWAKSKMEIEKTSSAERAARKASAARVEDATNKHWAPARRPPTEKTDGDPVGEREISDAAVAYAEERMRDGEHVCYDDARAHVMSHGLAKRLASTRASRARIQVMHDNLSDDIDRFRDVMRADSPTLKAAAKQSAFVETEEFRDEVLLYAQHEMERPEYDPTDRALYSRARAAVLARHSR